MTQASSKEYLDQMWKKWINDRDTHAGDMLIRQYIPLVSYHVQRIAAGLPAAVSKDDLKSFGMMGLFDALEKFDYNRDLKFDTYASFRIRGAILDGLRKEDWLPRSVREKSKRIEAAVEKLEQKHMRNVTAKEIAEEVEMSEEEVEQIISESFFANILSIDEPHKDGDDHKETMGANIEDYRVISPEEQLVKEELIEELAEQIKNLNENEQMVVSLFYKEELTLTEIGKVLGLSTSRISQIHSKALYKLKQALTKIMD